MITSSISQSIALIRLVSFDAWPLLFVSFLQTTRPIMYGLSGVSFFGVTGKSFYNGANQRHNASLLLPHENIARFSLERPK